MVRIYLIRHLRPWIFAGDSNDIALITDKTTTVVDQFGNYKVMIKTINEQANETQAIDRIARFV